MKPTNARFILAACLVLAAVCQDMAAQRIKGSDTVLPIAQETAERFLTLNPSASVTVTGGGSGVGISALLDNTTDIAMASRGIKFSEKMKAKAAGEELVEVTLRDDVIKIDGNMAVAWSGSLDFTVERSGRSLVGSAVSGEGLVNVYRGTGKVLFAPVR